MARTEVVVLGPVDMPYRASSGITKFIGAEETRTLRKLPSPKPSLPLRWMISKKIGSIKFFDARNPNLLNKKNRKQRLVN